MGWCYVLNEFQEQCVFLETGSKQRKVASCLALPCPSPILRCCWAHAIRGLPPLPTSSSLISPKGGPSEALTSPRSCSIYATLMSPTAFRLNPDFHRKGTCVT